MKKIFTLILVAIILQSCATVNTQDSIIRIKGRYNNPDTFYFSDRTQEEVWNATVKLICKAGYSVKFMEKVSGVIFLDKTDFLDVSTTENNKGLENPEAFVVTGKQLIYGMTLKPSNVIADWNIRIFQDNGKTAININLKNIKSITPINTVNTQSIVYESKSTGNFEKMIADSIVF